jgi:hypothetical protein
VVNELAFNERNQRRIGYEPGTVDHRVEGAKPFVKKFYLPLGVGAVRQVTLLKRKTRTIDVCGGSQIEPADDPVSFKELVNETATDLSSDARDKN